MKEPWTQKMRVWLHTIWREGPCKILGHRWIPNRADDRYEWCPRCQGGRMKE